MDVAEVTLQALRRTCEERLWKAGVSPQLAALILNHRVSTAERHYVDLRTLNATDAVQHLEWTEPGAPAIKTPDKDRRKKRRKESGKKKRKSA